MVLHVDLSGTGERLVLVHGFTQNGRCWGPFLEEFTDHELASVDAPGHGQSGHRKADLYEGARLIGDAGGRATYLGYSMGGRLCLHLALEQPELVERLVLIGATAGIDDPDERAQRIGRDEALARRLETEPLAEFLADWLALPLFERIPTDRDFLEERLSNDPSGLAASLRNAGTGSQEPLWGRLNELDMPVLLLTGERDEKFAQIARRMARSIGSNAEVASISGAGHAVHLEAPEQTGEAISRWLRST